MSNETNIPAQRRCDAGCGRSEQSRSRNAAGSGDAGIPEDAATALQPNSGRPYNPVVTLNGWTMPWRMNAGVKEFHLVAEPVVREFAPGHESEPVGLQRPKSGPTIEAVEGDRVRIFVTNRLPEHTTVHWHGMLLPSGMDGVGGLTQPHIPPGKTFVYEFTLTKSGTFMYHPHADEMVQMAMGMMGMFIVHPKDIRQQRVDRDFVFLLASYDIDPGSMTPKVDDHARLQPVDLEQPRVPGHRPLGVSHGRPGAHPFRQPHDDEPPHAPARARLRSHGYGWWMGPEVGALA